MHRRVYFIRSHNRLDKANTLRDAKWLAKDRAKAYALSRGCRVVWCSAACWGSDGERNHGGYAVLDGDGNDVAEGAAVIVSEDAP